MASALIVVFIAVTVLSPAEGFHHSLRTFQSLTLPSLRTREPTSSAPSSSPSSSISSPSKVCAKNDLNRYEDFLLQEDSNPSGGGSLSEGMRVKIKSEIVSPFRRFRQFVLFGILAAAGLGSVTSVPQLIIELNNDGGRLPLETLYQNVGVNLIGFLGAVYFLFKDFTSEAKTLEKFSERERKATEKLSDSELQENEKMLSLLPVEIQISEKDENVTRVVSVGDLQRKGNQNVIIVTGEKSFVKDATISARIEGINLFTEYNTVVIPVIFEEEQLEHMEKKSSKGFGSSRVALLESAYIGKPTQVNIWLDYLSREFEQAGRQGTKEAMKEGLVLVLNRFGKVTRRGVGLPPWKQLVEELINAERGSFMNK